MASSSSCVHQKRKAETALSVLHSEFDDLTTENDKLNKQNLDLQEHNCNLEEQSFVLQKQNCALEEKMNKLQKQNSDLTKRLYSLLRKPESEVTHLCGSVKLMEENAMLYRRLRDLGEEV